MTTLYIIREHHELLPLWRSLGARDLKLVHLDFHDDLRGLCIDRRGSRAHRTGIFREDTRAPDEGNFLVHAILEGMVARIRWVRAKIGGRAYEPGIVKYSEDLAAIPHRLAHVLRAGADYPLVFEEILAEQWPGPQEHEHLDLDWDCFASFYMDASGIEDRFEQFLEKAGGSHPPAVYFAYSPDHVHPTKKLFRCAVQRLSERLGAAPVYPGGEFIEGLPEDAPRRIAHAPLLKLILSLRKKGIY